MFPFFPVKGIFEENDLETFPEENPPSDNQSLLQEMDAGKDVEKYGEIYTQTQKKDTCNPIMEHAPQCFFSKISIFFKTVFNIPVYADYSIVLFFSTAYLFGQVHPDDYFFVKRDLCGTGYDVIEKVFIHISFFMGAEIPLIVQICILVQININKDTAAFMIEAIKFL